LYRPDLEQVVRGAISPDTEDVHYVTKYRYPTNGGFNSYINPMLAKATLQLDHRVTAIDPVEHVVSFANGAQEQYEHLISSIPLPELVPMVSGAPDDIIEAASLLTATSMVLVNVGVDREDVGDTWTYFYDPDIVFTRLSYPSSLSPNMAPPGCGSFQAEIYYSDKYKPLDEEPADLIDRTIADLRRTGLIVETDQILHESAVVVPYGNIIHDHDKVPALEAILPWVREQGIHLCGRYGLWGYQWTDEAFVTGEDAAQAALDGTDVAQTMVNA
jgi:protoporphyrinogen oxidase